MALDPGEEAGGERVTRPSPVELVLAGAVGGGSGTRQVPPESGRSRPARGYDVVPLLEQDVEAVAEFAVFGLPRYGREEPDWPQRRIAELTGSEGALGEFLATLPPGPRLATLLAAVDLDAVDEFTLVEVVAAFKRMEAWSAARAARAAATLAERPALNPTWPGTLPGRTRGECVAGEELALRLRASRLTAVRLAACGRAFRGMFQSTGAALEEGLIDWARAQAIVTTLEGLPTDVAMAAQWEVLDKAPGRTLRQVHADLARAIIAVDPDSADDRHRAAREKRCVDHPQPLPDGMAKVSAVLPAADAIALDTALDAAARAARNTGDPRTLDQLRADALSLMAHTALVLGHIGPNAGAHCACCREGGDDSHPPSRGPSASGLAPATAPSATDPPPASGSSTADPPPSPGPSATDPPPTTAPSATE
ncbi:MAG TPA: DUF222 domain-containing protein, partial [Phototrophicaceae bacterium]|nr:DUF222 domain-containing protein [Phototrophicaceae bacterium]